MHPEPVRRGVGAEHDLGHRRELIGQRACRAGAGREDREEQVDGVLVQVIPELRDEPTAGE